jgi:hypothetical protein
LDDVRLPIVPFLAQTMLVAVTSSMHLRQAKQFTTCACCFISVRFPGYPLVGDSTTNLSTGLLVSVTDFRIYEKLCDRAGFEEFGITDLVAAPSSV